MPTDTANPVVIGNADNSLVGVVQVYIAPTGTAAPATSVPYGTVWTTPWMASGYTMKGLNFNQDRKTNKLYVEELSTPVRVPVDTNDVTIDLEFAEDTLQSMKWAYGGGTITTTGTGATQVATLALSEDLNEVAIGFEGTAPAGNFRRVIVPTLVATGSVKTSYQRAKALRTYPATFTMLNKLSDVIIQEIGAGVESQ